MVNRNIIAIVNQIADALQAADHNIVDAMTIVSLTIHVLKSVQLKQD